MSKDWDTRWAKSQALKKEMDKLEREERKIDKEAGKKKDKIWKRRQAIQKQCEHLSRDGDAFDSWCTICGLRNPY